MLPRRQWGSLCPACRDWSIVGKQRTYAGLVNMLASRIDVNQDLPAGLRRNPRKLSLMEGGVPSGFCTAKLARLRYELLRITSEVLVSGEK